MIVEQMAKIFDSVAACVSVNSSGSCRGQNHVFSDDCKLSSANSRVLDDKITSIEDCNLPLRKTVIRPECDLSPRSKQHSLKI